MGTLLLAMAGIFAGTLIVVLGIIQNDGWMIATGAFIFVVGIACLGELF